MVQDRWFHTTQVWYCKVGVSLAAILYIIIVEGELKYPIRPYVLLFNIHIFKIIYIGHDPRRKTSLVFHYAVYYFKNYLTKISHWNYLRNRRLHKTRVSYLLVVNIVNFYAFITISKYHRLYFSSNDKFIWVKMYKIYIFSSITLQSQQR